MSPSRNAALRRRLLAWFDRERRPMPWRETPTPYRVWISEIMLQQTQVATVIPYFERFVARLPDLESLATVDEEALLSLWSGLGYYRRARNLQAAARQVLAEHGGALPADADVLATLPGVGRYTAGAVSSIAFGRPEPALDGNGIRFLTRLDALAGDPARQPLQGQLWGRLGELVRGERPGDLNQAVMELGAKVCRPRNPDCDACPAAPHCLAHARGESTAYPQGRRGESPVELRLEVGLFRRRDDDGRLLLARGARPLLGTLWNLPFRVLDDAAGLAAERWTALGLRLSARRELGEGRHGVTRYLLRQQVLSAVAELRPVGEGIEYRWASREELPALGLPAFSRKLLKRFDSDSEQV